MNSLNKVLIILSALLLSACDKADQQALLHKTIVAEQQAFMAAYQHGDASGIAKLYLDDAKVMPANREFVTERANIRLFWQGLMQLGITTVKLETIDVDGQNDLAYETGRYTIHTSDEAMIDFGKYLIVWRQVDEQWFIYRHIWTTSMIKVHESRI